MSIQRPESERVIVFNRNGINRSSVSLSWSDLNSFGNSKALAYSWVWLAVVPIAAKAFSNIDAIAIPALGESFVINPSLPFSWHILFFSSAAFAAAGLMYGLLCPDLVKRFDKPSDLEKEIESNDARNKYVLDWYAEALLTNASNDDGIGRADDAIEYVGAKYMTPNSSAVKILVPRPDGSVVIDFGEYSLPSKNFSDVFYLTHQECNEMRPVRRRICASFYAIGFALLFALIAQNFLYVVDQFREDLPSMLSVSYGSENTEG